jgi:Spy/CpxP family protein refolding chaperone
MKFIQKSMLPVAAVLSGAALVAATAMAQQDAPRPPQGQGQWQGRGPGGPGGPERRLEMMQHRLNLSAEQTTQIKAIFADGRTKMEALRGNTELAPQDRRTQGEALRKDETAKVEALLNPDQKLKFEEMEARQRERMKEGRGPGGPGGPKGSGSDDAPPPPPPPPPPSL